MKKQMVDTHKIEDATLDYANEDGDVEQSQDLFALDEQALAIAMREEAGECEDQSFADHDEDDTTVQYDAMSISDY